MPGQQAPLQKVAINYPTRSAASWPMFIAKEGGYYQKYGLDVELVFGAGTVGVAMIASGDAVMTNSSMEQALQASSRDASLVSMGGSLNKGMFSLMAAKNFTVRESAQGQTLRREPDRRCSLQLHARAAQEIRDDRERCGVDSCRHRCDGPGDSRLLAAAPTRHC